MTVAFQCMFGILERWNNNQVTPSLSKPHELSYRSNSLGNFSPGPTRTQLEIRKDREISTRDYCERSNIGTHMGSDIGSCIHIGWDILHLEFESAIKKNVSIFFQKYGLLEKLNLFI